MNVLVTKPGIETMTFDTVNVDNAIYTSETNFTLYTTLHEVANFKMVETNTFT